MTRQSSVAGATIYQFPRDRIVGPNLRGAGQRGFVADRRPVEHVDYNCWYHEDAMRSARTPKS